MRDQPQAWQYRSNDAAEPATGTVPAPREAADDPDPDGATAGHDSSESTAWAPTREGDQPSRADAPEATEVSGSPDLDAPAPSPDVDAAVREDGEPAVGVAQVPDPDGAGKPGDTADEESGPGAHGQTADGATAHGFTGHTAALDEPDGRGVALDEAGDETDVDRRTDDETDVDRPATGTTGYDGTGYDGTDSDGASDRLAPGDSVAADEVEPGDETAVRDEAALDGTGVTGSAADQAVTGDTAVADGTAVDGTAVDEAATADAAAGGPATAAADRASGGELMPGDVPEQPMASLFEGTAADGFRDRWQRVQMRFVDSPRSAADEARVLTGDVVSALHDALDQRISSLGEWQSGQAGDTEELRIAVRRYRDLLERLLGL